MLYIRLKKTNNIELMIENPSEFPSVQEIETVSEPYVIRRSTDTRGLCWADHGTVPGETWDL